MKTTKEQLVKVTMEKNGKRFYGTLPESKLDKVTTAEMKGFRVVRYQAV
jgi:hypothetical protein